MGLCRHIVLQTTSAQAAAIRHRALYTCKAWLTCRVSGKYVLTAGNQGNMLRYYRVN